MNRLALAVLVSIPVASFTAAQATPGLPSERPTPQKQPTQPKNPRPDCTKNAVTEHKPWLSSAVCAAKASPKPAGGSCRWADECLSGYCVDNGAGGGACASQLTETPACTQAMGPGDGTAIWVGGVVSFACAGKGTSDATKLCTLLPKRTAKPTCANDSMTGHSCGVDQPCTTTEMCRDNLECVKSYPNPVGKCATSASTPCSDSQGSVSYDNGTRSLCVQKSLVCQ